MCDIGRFDYHWVEGDERLRQRAGARAPAASCSRSSRARRCAKIAERVDAGGGTGALRFLISAHASIEELFLLGRMGGAFGLPEDGVAISWRTRAKPQPAGTKFKIPPVDAPNVQGRGGPRLPRQGHCERRAGPRGVPAAGREPARVKALFVFDPGPAGSIGDVSWVIDARQVGQAAAAHRAGRADDATSRAPPTSSCPGACAFEKDGAYVNQQGHAAGRGAGADGAGRRAGRLADLRQSRDGARRDAGLHRRRARARRRGARARPATRPTPGWPSSRSPGPWARRTGCRRPTRRNAGSGT